MTEAYTRPYCRDTFIYITLTHNGTLLEEIAGNVNDL